MQIDIHFRTADEIVHFVNIACRMDGEVTLASDGYVANAKSVMGIFNLDFSKNLNLVVKDWKDEYAEKLKPYVI